MTSADPPESPRLKRRLGLTDAIVIGLGSMLGAGVFSAFSPAAQAAGTGLLLGLAVAAAIAYCNATSSARLAARYPDSGGTYVYGRERLGPFWGYLAGWGFIVGKTASCAAMALTVVAYTAPSADRLVRTVIVVAIVAGMTVLNYFGVHKSAWLTRLIVAITLIVLILTVTGCFAGGTADTGHLRPITGAGVVGVLQAGGLLFFAFAGYARIATLGEEVRDPARTIPRAIPIALSIVLVVYAAVAVAVLVALGPTQLATAVDPLAQAVAVGSWSWMVPVVRVGAAAAALGSFLALLLGVSRTTLAMARDGHLPKMLSGVHPRYGVPHRAEITVGVVVALLASLVDLRGAIGFSSFAVLVYYAVANASAWTLHPAVIRRIVPTFGLAGCLIIAFSLPIGSVLAGLLVLGIGVLWWAIRHWTRRPPQPTGQHR